MASRQRFHSTVSSDTKKIRAKFLEAKRAGANTADASAYANGKIDKIIKPQPMVAPPERERLMPAAWTSPAPGQEYESPDKTEVRKRVVLQPGAFEPKPAAAVVPAVTVAAAAEIANVAEQLDKVLTPAKPAIPPDFDRPAFPWPQLRSLATSMGCSANGRADAVASIKAKLIEESQPLAETPPPSSTLAVEQ